MTKMVLETHHQLVRRSPQTGPRPPRCCAGRPAPASPADAGSPHERRRAACGVRDRPGRKCPRRAPGGFGSCGPDGVPAPARCAAGGIDWRAADATDPEAAADAAKGASVIYQCLNAPYTQWPERFPPLQRGVLAAAERTGALLVSLENLYGYGPTGGRPMTEDLPLAATTVKGRTRAAMTAELLAAADAGRVRIAIGRASDFFGPGVTQGSVLGERVFGNALAGRRADFIGNPDLPHTYSYVPDIAAGLATLGTDARAAGQVWHLPGPPTVTTRALLDLVAAEVGHPVGVRSVPKLAVRALGLVNPMMRGAGRDGLRVRPALHPGHQQIPGRVRGGRHPAGRRHRRDPRLVPDPARHAMTTTQAARHDSQRKRRRRTPPS